MNNDTPETDGKASSIIGFFSCATVPADFARKLERERDEAREQNAKLRDIAERAIGWLEEGGPDDVTLGNKLRTEFEELVP